MASSSSPKAAPESSDWRIEGGLCPVHHVSSGRMAAVHARLTEVSRAARRACPMSWGEPIRSAG
ncbi:MAG: hypothetical protein ACK55Z_32355, partial [bacterium]